MYFRWIVWGLGLANMFIVIFYTRIVILGPIRTWLRKNHGVSRELEC
jgi:hypothetical protein